MFAGSRLSRIVMAGLAVSVVAFGASATPLPLNDGPEVALYQIVNNTYGTTFTSSAELQPFIVIATPPAFEVFNDAYQINLVAIYAGNTQTFGYYDDLGVGANRTPLFTVAQGGNAVASVPGGADFGFYLTTGPYGGTNTWFSESSLNSDGLRHMYLFDLEQIQSSAYAAAGVNAADYHNRFVIAWEDLPPNTRWSDFDFNDLVLEANIVPEPATVVLLGLGIAGMAAKRFRQRKA